MKLRSYAKINLTLDILGKRKDGYHELETVFQQINLYDEIELTELKEDKIIIECNIKEIENKENIAYKAAELLKRKYSVKKGVKIKINKKIPIGTGLSGGSSNAATVLKGLNILWDLNLSKEELVNISKEIGMDVGFHVLGGTCLGKGRGEILEKINDLKKYYAVVVYPGFPISTKKAYSGLNYDRIGKKKNTPKFIKNHDLKYLHNDFEYSILEKYPELKEIKKSLGKNSLISGSGSCVFGLFKKEEDAKKAYSKLKKEYNHTFLATTLNKKIEKAKEIGFCFGVKRAIEDVKEIGKLKKVYVLGKLIHNPQVISKLENDGIKMIDEFKDIKDGTIVISAHGINDKTIDEIKKSKLELVDLTCPLVKKVHDITKEAEKRGRKIIVYGDEEHTEVRGIVGNLKSYKVIRSADELNEDDLKCRLTLISQTTKELDKFQDVAENIKKAAKDVEVKDTICFTTKERQKSSMELAKKSDIMIVIGGRMSSNTARLAESCARFCETKHIESEKELKTEWFFDKEAIGITAGTSTPYGLIDVVVQKLEMIL
jgi:(E)-4-hydroxy-3-methyl-but-2-enyl pyrophosphate reductase/4-diphosphocytidyl-2C-methyl-D-erythritol kinase